MIIEAAYAIAGAPLRLHALAWSDDWETSALAAVNPLLQVPALVFADGVVMTESAAILLDLADRHPDADLAPPASHPARRAFLRRLIMLVAAVYPTFTYGDLPTRFVEGDAAAGEKLRRATDARREYIYRLIEGASGTPWFLGDTFSALDLYVWAINGWRPREAWFAAHAPRMAAIAGRVGALAALQPVIARNAAGAQPPA